MRGVAEAMRLRLIEPILVGPIERMRRAAEQVGLDIGGVELVDAEHSHASAAKAVELVRAGKAEALMKGSLHTDELMGAVVSRASGIRTERRISHCFIMDVPGHPDPLIITDAAVNIAPDLDAKVDIIQNAIDLAHAMGAEQVRVAILSAMETVTTKVPSTIEAAALCKMAERGQITGAVLDGPLALDNAISPEAAAIKKIASPVAGRANILVVPDLEAGNMLAKSLSFLAKADAAGIVLGARVPIILTSRADSLISRLASCAVAVMVAAAKRKAAVAYGAVREQMSDASFRPVLAGTEGARHWRGQRRFHRLRMRESVSGRRGGTRHFLAEREGEKACRAACAGARGVDRRRSRRRRSWTARGDVRPDPFKVGPARHPGAFDRLRAQGRPSGRDSQLFGRRLRQGDGRFVPFLRSNGEARGAADDEWRDDVRDELLSAPTAWCRTTTSWAR